MAQVEAAAFVRTIEAPPRPPPMPRPSKGLGERTSAFLAHLARHPLSLGAMMLAMLAMAYALFDLSRFLIIDAVWRAPNGALCRAPGAGACWAFIGEKLPYFIYGAYPLGQRWRVNLVFAVGAGLIVWLLWRGAPHRRLAAPLFFIAYPIAALILLAGCPPLGLPFVASSRWGGVMLTLIVAGSGIVISLPLGVVLALGRRSRLPLLRIASTAYIEILRGVPLITVLFMTNTMLPLFVPHSLVPSRLVRALVGVALFAAAYMAEVVRGGLQAMPKGQGEAASALGLSYWARQRLIILPQALRLVIPAIVNTAIGLFKDTTLVATVGLFDFLRSVDSARLDPAWAGPTITPTAYVFAAGFYFLWCFAMARYALFLERSLAARRGV